MPDIKFQHVVSCSSEDPSHPAANLIKPETYRKWRCAKSGEEQACVILQLEKETQIHSIDIGNNCSAFVEVLVGKSSSPPDTPFEVLLGMSSFMSPGESKSGSPSNRVRMFTQTQLCQDTAKLKWDRVKIVCTQPFTNHMQYGISFISLHSPPEAEETTPLPSTSTSTSASPPVKLGKFTLRAEEEDDIRPGSLFARMKDKKDDSSGSLFTKMKKELSPQKPKTAAAAIAEASSPSSLAVMESSKTKAANIKPRKREHSADKDTTNKKRNGNHTPDKAGSSPAASKGSMFKGDNRKALERDTPPPESPGTPEPPKVRVTRPFKELMKDVVIVLSGFQNPLRGTLRHQAAEMGAKYQADWDTKCTHLICAFPKTPKARQVKATGNGKIVKKEWIEHSHREKKRFPWRRYAMEAADQDADESEEEIWDVNLVPSTGTTSQARDDYDGETDDDDDVQMESITKPTSTKTDTAGDSDDNDITELPTPRRSIEKPAEVINLADDDYNADTDVDSDEDVTTLPPLPDFLSKLTFSLHEELSEKDKKQLKRYITAFKGKLNEDLDESVNYLITETTDGLSELAAFFPDVKAVRPQFIWSCNDAGKLLAEEPFLLKSS